MTPTEKADGHYVTTRDGTVVGPFRTNAEAWGWIDRHSDEGRNDSETEFELPSRQQIDPPLFAMQRSPSGQWLIRIACANPFLPSVIVIDEARPELEEVPTKRLRDHHIKADNSGDFR